MDEHDEKGAKRKPYFIIHLMLFSFVVVHLTMWTQLCHVSRQKYTPILKLYLLPTITMLVVDIVCTFTKVKVDTKMTIAVLFGVMEVFQWIFIVVVIYELTEGLDISVFRTK